VRRREFIALLSGAAGATWSQVGRTQQPEPVRRIGMLMSIDADNAEAQPRVAAFQQRLQQLGWTDDRNERIDVRRGAGDSDRIRESAAELVNLAPDAILAAGSVPLEQKKGEFYGRSNLAREKGAGPDERGSKTGSHVGRHGRR